MFVVVFIITADYIKNRRPVGFPPGPGALPVVGNIFTWDQSRPHEKLMELARTYGDVYSLRFGQKWIVVLNGFEALKEGLVTKGDSMVDRPQLPLQDEITHGLDAAKILLCGG
ncbi:hypothetical protein ILYODFUR_028671 [Ilyodon furcidens]|uniref:Uncharacterized protein n=1 Tax=Ilyodon furcidens TaxID=33524 RepID=A0ABV0TYG8_9TELE